MNKNKIVRRGLFSGTLSYAYLLVLSVFAVFPLVWILISSVKGKGEIFANATSLIPKTVTLENYKTVFVNLHFMNNIGNSLLVAFSSTVLSIAISALGAYGIVRFFPKFGKLMTRILITTYMFPPILLAVPFSIVMGKIGLVNSHIGLILVYLSFSVPYAIWLLVGFFQTVPLEIEEAGTIDGANKLQVFWRIVLPIITPGLVAVAIYTFINSWNEFLYALIMLNSSAKMTVSVALKSLEGQEVLDWGTMMAASAIVVIPSIIFFMIIQKKIASGLADGSVK